MIELFDYGIHNESSNIRAHVAPLARKLYVFPTISAVRVMGNYPKRMAYQPGVEGATAEGHTVPPSAIEHMRRVAIPECYFDGFVESLTTSQKGDKAVEIVHGAMKRGSFPVWFDGEFVTDHKIQTTGTDIIVSGRWKIEVKCDFRASDERGKPHERCTGKLFIQIAERNPLRRI